MKSNRFFGNDDGFTLIEALIAIAIFSIGLLAVGALQANSLKRTGNIAQRTEAWAVLDNQVAQLKSQAFYQDPAAKTFTPGLDDTGGGFTQQVDRQMNGTYTVYWRVADDTPLGPQNAAVLSGLPAGTYTVCKTITVRVTRQGGNPLNANAVLAEAQFIKTWAATDL